MSQLMRQCLCAVVAASMLGSSGCAEIDVGSSAAAIVGGAPTDRFDGVGFLPGCTGVLVSPTVVLTTASCVDPAVGASQPTDVYFGTAAHSDPLPLATIAVSDTELHPDWDGTLTSTDAALLLLAEPTLVAPLALNRAALSDADIGLDVTLVGWGAADSDHTGTGVKRSVSTKVVDVQDDVVVFGAALATTCFGDGGGPVVATENGVPVVIALQSYGPPSYDGPAGGPRIDVIASDFIDPFVAQHAPDTAEPDLNPEDGTEDEMDAAGCSLTSGSTPDGPALLLLALCGVVRRRSAC